MADLFRPGDHNSAIGRERQTWQRAISSWIIDASVCGACACLCVRLACVRSLCVHMCARLHVVCLCVCAAAG